MTPPSPAPSGDAPDLLGDDALVEAAPGLLAVAAGLTGSPDAAADLVATTLTRRSRPVREALTAELPEPRLRSLVVQEFLHDRRRSASRAGDGLDALPARARAGVVLRDGLHLTPLEIAAVLDRAAPAVITELEGQPDRSAEVAARMAAAPGLDALRARLPAATLDRRRRHRRVGLLLGAAAVLVAALIAVPTVVLPRLPSASREPGTWHYSHEIDTPSGWSVVLRTITPTVETSEVKPPTVANDPYLCYVEVYVRGAYQPDRATASATTFRGRPALSGNRQGQGTGYLAWEYGDDAWAVTSCSSSDEDSDVLRQVGGMVRFRDQPIRIPFELAAVPSDYTITSLNEYPDSHLAEVLLTRPELRSGIDVNLVVSGPLDHFRVGGRDVTVSGRRWIYTDGVEPRMCTVDGADRTICVAGLQPGGDQSIPLPYPRLGGRQINEVVASLTPAADLGAPDTWPTGSDLPR